MEVIQISIFSNGPVVVMIDAIRQGVIDLVKTVEENFPTLIFYIEEFSRGHILSITSKKSDFLFYEFAQSSNLFGIEDFRKDIMTEIKSSLPPETNDVARSIQNVYRLFCPSGWS